MRARLTFIGLWTACDDEGRYLYEPELLKADLWPFENDVTAQDVESDVAELAKRALVCIYETAGKRYLHVVNWHEHQKINRPTTSRLPDCSGNPHGGFPEDSSPRARAQEVEVEREREREGSNTVVEQARPIDDTTAVFTTWQQATGKHRARLDPKRRKRIRDALKHYPLADVLDAVQGWQHSPHHAGQNPHGTVFNDLELLLRDAAHLEQFRDLWRDGPPPVMGRHTREMAEYARQMTRLDPGREATNGELVPMDGDRALAQRELPRPEDRTPNS